VVVCSAGNNNGNVGSYSPANYSKTIAVAATDQNDVKVDFSNYGSKIDVAAPGGESGFWVGGICDASKANILSLRAEGTDIFQGNAGYTPGDAFFPIQGDPNSKYYRCLGTSMAAPHVSGIAALVRATTPSWLTNEDILEIIAMSCDDIGDPGEDNLYGSGRVNAYQAMLINDFSEPPVFEPLADKWALINSLLEFEVAAQTQWGALEYSAENLPPWATFDPNTQIFSGEPNEFDKGSYEITFAVTNGYQTVRENVIITTLVIEETRITSEPEHERYPATYEGIIVYERNGDIYMDITGQVIPIHTGPGQQRKPTAYIDGNTVVTTYEDDRNGNWDIYMTVYDLITTIGVETQLTNDPYDQRDPAAYVDGNTVVTTYEDDRNGNWDIYMTVYDLITTIGVETQLTNDPYDQHNPTAYVDGNTVVTTYEDDRNGNWDIYMTVYDLITTIGVETQLTDDSYVQHNPATYEGITVWDEYNPDDWPNEQKDIYMYNLPTDQVIQITTDLSTQWQPAIYKRITAYSDLRNGNADIYKAELILAPRILSVVPSRVAVDESFTISGTDFNDTQGTSTVEFENEVEATIVAWSDTQITCTVPAGAETGLLRVITDEGASNGATFVLISAFSPADLDYDDDVDWADLEIFVDSWLKEVWDEGYNPACNFNYDTDDIVDFLDFATFVADWLAGK